MRQRGVPSTPSVPRTVPWSREDWMSAAMEASLSMMVRTVDLVGVTL